MTPVARQPAAEVPPAHAGCLHHLGNVSEEAEPSDVRSPDGADVSRDLGRDRLSRDMLATAVASAPSDTARSLVPRRCAE